MDFREFSEAYNDYLMHKAPSSGTRKTYKNYVSTSDQKEPPKHVAYELASSGWTLEQVEEWCKRGMAAFDSPANHKYWSEVLRIFKEQYVSHNDFREYSDYLMHYGRKGMRWGKAIFQDDYDPVGQEAKGNDQGGSHNDTVGRLARAGQYLTNPVYGLYQAGRYIANNAGRTENRINDTVKPATGRQNPNAAQNAQREQSMQSGRETMNNLYNQAGQGRSDLASSYNNVMNGHNTVKDKKHFTPRERQQLENDWNSKIDQMVAGLKRARKQRANYKKGPSPEEQILAKLEQGFAQLQQNAQDRKTDTEIERGVLAMQNFLKDPSNFQKNPNAIQQLYRDLVKSSNRDPKGKS